MHTRNFGSSSPASKVYSFRKTRTFIVKILIRFSNAYAGRPVDRSMGYRRRRSEPINRRITTPDAVFSILERYAVWILSHFRVSEGGAIKFRFDVPIIRNRQSTFSRYKRLCCGDVKLLILLASEASPDNPPLGTTSPNEFIALEISPVRPIFHASIRGIILASDAACL